MNQGRKYKVTVICISMLTLGFAAAGFNELLGETFGEFAMGLSGLLGLYCGGNVGNKFVAQKKPVEDK